MNQIPHQTHKYQIDRLLQRLAHRDHPIIVFAVSGVIERKRKWEEQSYSWSVSQWGISTAQDLRVLADDGG